MMRGREASERFAERRRRENEAPRLRDVVPRLRACRIDIEEGRDSATSADIKHTRRIVVEHAPALFVISCGDPACKEGGHDVTSDLLRGLREGRETIAGEDRCYGHIGMADCGRLMRFTVSAVYEPAAGSQPSPAALRPSA